MSVASLACRQTACGAASATMRRRGLEPENVGARMDLGLADRVVLVTGASKGIGHACAAAFLAEGAKVALVSRSRANLDAALARLPRTTFTAVRDRSGHDRRDRRT